VVDGSPLAAAGVAAVSKWPTRLEQLSLVSGQILSPGALLASQLTSLGGALASQIKQHGEKAEGSAEAAEPVAGSPEPVAESPDPGATTEPAA
jgi:large subunit ribosomal protein L10